MNKGFGPITFISHNPDTVADGNECPNCGEDRCDLLVWRDSDEGEYVECTSCGAWYDPNEEV